MKVNIYGKYMAKKSMLQNIHGKKASDKFYETWLQAKETSSNNIYPKQ